jgi:hypothetical protein
MRRMWGTDCALAAGNNSLARLCIARQELLEYWESSHGTGREWAFNEDREAV